MVRLLPLVFTTMTKARATSQENIYFIIFYFGFSEQSLQYTEGLQKDCLMYMGNLNETSLECTSSNCMTLTCALFLSFIIVHLENGQFSCVIAHSSVTVIY